MNKVASELVKIADEMEWKIKKTKDEFEKHAKEKLDVEIIKGSAYAFGSELATLRLLKAYRDVKHARQGYSANMNSFYFELELKV